MKAVGITQRRPEWLQPQKVGRVVQGEEAGLLVGFNHSELPSVDVSVSSLLRKAGVYFTPPHPQCRTRHLVNIGIRQVPVGSTVPRDAGE